MATFPAIARPSRGLEEEYYLPQKRTDFEANYVQTRKSVTRGRGKWPLVWNILSEANYQTLLTFFKANQGNSFTWIHPVSSVSYTCIFSADSIKGKIGKYPNTRESVQCPIEEQ